jgi:outer membrane immunogenic protein
MLMDLGRRSSRIAVASVLSALMLGILGGSASAQTAYCWINAKNGQPVPDSDLVPQGARKNPLDPNHASLPGAPAGPPFPAVPATDFVRVSCPPPTQSTGLQTTPSTSWTGPFLGGQVGGSWSRVGTNEFDAFTGLHTNAFNDNGGSVGGGVNFGYNWQPWGDKIVVGFVLDGTFLNDRVVHTFPYNANSIASTINAAGSLQARAGLLVTPSLLLYGQTGVSVAGQRLQINFGGAYPTDTTGTTPGYMLGGGAEWALPTSPLAFGAIPSFFVAYEHTWWDTASLYRPAASSNFNYMWQRQSDAVKGGVRIRFAP